MDATSTPLTEQEALSQLVTLLDQTYEHFLSHPDNELTQSAEGSVQVHYGTIADRERASTSGRARITGVSIYSRTFRLTPRPGSTHEFASVREALEAVRTAHAKELATDWYAHYARLWDNWGTRP